MRVIVIAHDDADGVCSARIIKLFYPNAEILVPPYGYFGVPDEFVDNVSADKLFIVDLGTVGLEPVISQRENFGDVVVIDHHTLRGSEDVLKDANIELVHHEVIPSSLLTYFYFKKRFGDNKTAQKYGIIGSFGDMADGLYDVWTLLQKYREGNEELFSTSEKSKWVGAVRASAVLNCPRRLFWHKGVYFLHNAIDEIKDNIDVMVNGIVGTEKELDFQKWALVEHWKRYWNIWAPRIYRTVDWFVEENDRLAFGFVETNFNVAGYFASVGADQFKKPAIVVNMGSPICITISARKPRTGEGWVEDLDLDALFYMADELSDGKITGGGHKDASGGSAPKGTQPEEIIEILLKAFKEVSG